MVSLTAHTHTQALLARFFPRDILSEYCEQCLGNSGKGGEPVLAARIAKAWARADFTPPTHKQQQLQTPVCQSSSPPIAVPPSSNHGPVKEMVPLPSLKAAPSSCDRFAPPLDSTRSVDIASSTGPSPRQALDPRHSHKSSPPIRVVPPLPTEEPKAPLYGSVAADPPPLLDPTTLDPLLKSSADRPQLDLPCSKKIKTLEREE